MTIYRMHRAERSAGDYTDAMLAGGRWNSIGTPMFYTAEHLSLAGLEVLVHLDKASCREITFGPKRNFPSLVGPLIPQFTAAARVLIDRHGHFDRRLTVRPGAGWSPAGT
jgi:hypothetical protein